MGIYDWDAEPEGGEVERELARLSRLGHGNGSPLSRAEFYAVMEMHVRDTAAFHKRIDQLEDTVYAPKRLLVAVLWSGWGRLILVLLAVLVALIVAESREHLNLDWLWNHQP